MPEKLSVGGQAVIEGVMMRSQKLVATAVRRPNGEVVVRKTEFISVSKRQKILGLPVLRGAIVLIETLALGISALTYSAEEALKEDGVEGSARSGGRGREEEERGESAPGRELDQDQRRDQDRDQDSLGDQNRASGAGKKTKKPGETITTVSLALTMVVSLALGFLLFFYLPLFVAEQMGLESGFWFNVVDGIVRLLVFVLYIKLVGLWGEMKKLYQYHGAEHKSIHAFEAGEELTPENAMKHTTLHPRCGTSFLLMVVIVSLLVFIALGKPDNWTERGVRFLCIPLIAGVAFEITKLSGKYAKSSWAAALIAPGLWFQRMTTREPTREQVEVALRALREVL